MPKTITLAEVEEHKDRNSCWVVIDNKVYDVSKFLDEHPGGEEVILDYGGRFATEPFEDVGHSEDARWGLMIDSIYQSVNHSIYQSFNLSIVQSINDCLSII